MSSSTRHPAFYISRRQIWSTLPGSKPKWIYRCFRQTGLGTNSNTLHDVWYTIFLIVSTLWLIFIGVWRYREFKEQAYDPRYGAGWNESATLHVQLGALILAFAIFPVMIYSSVAQTGHLANDSVSLGRDLLHLHRTLTNCTIAQRLWKSTGSGNQPLNDSQAASGQRGPSMADEELDTLLLKRRGQDCYPRTLHSIRPFSTVLFVLIVYILLFPVCVLESEQLRNEAIDPVYVLHSDLDCLFGQSHLTNQLKQARIVSDMQFRVDHQNERPFPSHAYPVIPSHVGVEFGIFAISLSFLTVRYPMPFYFTSRVFSTVFSSFIALTSMYLLIDSATIAVVYKLFSVGIREPGGALIIGLEEQEKVLTPWQCLILSVSGLPAILINLMAVYAYGEEQFHRAIVNYAQLLIAGDIPPSRSVQVGDPNKVRCNGTLAMECSANDCLENNGSFATADRGTLEDPVSVAMREACYGWPLTIAVTTKYWRPPLPSSGRRSARASRKTNTPVLGQYPSNDSEASSTLKRLPGANMNNGSGDMTASAHTLTDLSEPSKGSAHKRSHFGVIIVASISFVWLLVTRMCLAAPLLRCFWQTKYHLILINIIVTVLYLVIWLLLWFGLGVKNAWRFRLLHTTWPFWSRANPIPGASMDNGHVNYGPDGQTSMTVNPFQTTYPALWPYVPYAPWITSSGPAGMSAGLPVGDTTEMHQLSVPLPAGNGMPEAGSGGDSLYGCFAELTPTGQANVSTGMEQYQAHLPSTGLRAGPPTVSDESEVMPEPGDHLDGNSRYFKPVQPSVSFNNGLTSASSYRTSNHPSCSPSPFSHIVCDPGSRGTSPVIGVMPVVNNARVRGQHVTATQNLLVRQGRTADGIEPTYATLTTLSRPTGRAASVTPDSRGQTPVNHQSTYRRNGSRVTFKDHVTDPSGMFHSVQQHQQQSQQDAATGSSDSGVYTNGHGTNGNNDRPIQRGRIKPELFALYGEVHAPANGRISVHPPLAHKPSLSYGRSNIQGADDVEMSTDMTSYVGQAEENVMTRSSDQLCSQV